MKSILRVRTLDKVYPDGTTALKAIDLDLNPGEFVAVIGPSGSGKSTLLRCINRLINPSAGTIMYKSEDFTKASRSKIRELRREMGMVFQGHNLIDRVTVLRNVLHGRLGYKRSVPGALGLFTKAEIHDAMRLLDRVGLLEHAYKRADELSGGQQQRVGIARALAQQPSLILADEPIANLDPKTSEDVMDYLYSICEKDGIACLVNLHQVPVAKKYAHRIIGLHKGRKIFDGRPAGLTESVLQELYYQGDTRLDPIGG